MGFPIVFEHMDACGIRRGKRVKVPAIAAAAAVLVSRGADQLVVPTPSAYEVERAEEVLSWLPKERRHLVKIVDRKGKTLRRVRDYLEPLAAQAHKWPESAFVSCAEDFLYQLAVATDFRAGVAGHAIQTVRGFVPIINPQSFRGEAKFRLAEAVSLICSYEPNLSDHGAYRLDLVPKPEASAQIWDLVENAEFGALVAMGGRIGYLTRPAVAFRRLRKAARTFFKKPETARIFTLATSVAELAGAKPIGDKAKSIAALATESGNAAFCPPFVDLGSASIGVYRLALAAAHAGPPSGAILIFEHSRDGNVSHSWLNVGEELNLEREERDVEGSRARLLRARAALEQFF
jgi:hypothetical protein